MSVFQSNETLFVFCCEGELGSGRSPLTVGAAAGGVARVWVCSQAGEEALTPWGLSSVTSAWGPALGECQKKNFKEDTDG